MTTEFQLDLNDIDTNEIESGSDTPPGWYFCVLEDVYPSKSNDSQTILEYKVLHGPFKGYKIFDHLVDPGSAADAEKAKTCVRRMLLVGKRLGILTQQEIDAAKATGSINVDFLRAIGRQAWLQTKPNTYKDQKTGLMKTNAKVDFNGIYPPNDERVPEDVRRKVSFDGGSGNGGAAAAGGGNGAGVGAGTGAAAGTATSPANGGGQQQRRPTMDDFSNI